MGKVNGTRKYPAQHLLGLKLAHDAVMLDDAQKVLAQQRAVGGKHGERHFGVPAGPEGDDVIHVGDSTTTNVNQGLGKALWAAILATALVAGGSLALAGLGFAGLLKTALPPPSPTAPAPVFQAPEYEVEISVKDGQMQLGPPRPVK